VISIAFEDETIGEVFNIGGEGEISIMELANRIINLTNSKSSIRHTSYDEAYGTGFEDMQRRVPDLTKIKSMLNWTPTINLNEIILDVASSMAKEI